VADNGFRAQHGRAKPSYAAGRLSKLPQDFTDPTIVFYSIDSLLPAEEPLPEGGFIRGQKYSVPGIQD